uniref:hypothetical protein n=1 Tax=Staphylococcus epidermidis TaxID=1282 RepID=UPI0037DA12A6
NLQPQNLPIVTHTANHIKTPINPNLPLPIRLLTPLPKKHQLYHPDLIINSPKHLKQLIDQYRK